jgi:hypothetical protein
MELGHLSTYLNVDSRSTGLTLDLKLNKPCALAKAVEIELIILQKNN